LLKARREFKGERVFCVGPVNETVFTYPDDDELPS
jgi:hypothetical protein